MINLEKNNDINKRMILGILFVLVGLVLLLRNLELIPWELPEYLISWQMLLIVIGVINLITGHRSAAFILISLGVFFMSTKYFDLSFREIWPIILILVGLGFFFRSRTNTLFQGVKNGSLDDLAVFGGSKKIISDLNFKGGKITTIFGGTQIDMRQAKMDTQEAVLDISTIFGGSEIHVPSEWNVKFDAVPIFGGFDDKRINKIMNPEAPTLYIKGIIMFGGCEIKN